MTAKPAHTERETQQEQHAADEKTTVSKLAGGRVGALAILAGGALLVRAAMRLPTRTGRALVQAGSGIALIALGWHSRKSEGKKEVSDEAHAARGRQEVPQYVDQDQPEGFAGESDTEARDSGEDEYTEHAVVESGSDIADTEEEDPRMEETDEAELSEAKMAAETGEAAGPSPEQSEPASTEEVEPEPTSEGKIAERETEESEPEDVDEDITEIEPGGIEGTEEMELGEAEGVGEMEPDDIDEDIEEVETPETEEGMARGAEMEEDVEAGVVDEDEMLESEAEVIDGEEERDEDEEGMMTEATEEMMESDEEMFEGEDEFGDDPEEGLIEGEEEMVDEDVLEADEQPDEELDDELEDDDESS